MRSWIFQTMTQLHTQDFKSKVIYISNENSNVLPLWGECWQQGSLQLMDIPQWRSLFENYYNNLVPQRICSSGSSKWSSLCSPWLLAIIVERIFQRFCLRWTPLAFALRFMFIISGFVLVNSWDNSLAGSPLIIQPTMTLQFVLSPSISIHLAKNGTPSTSGSVILYIYD